MSIASARSFSRVGHGVGQDKISLKIICFPILCVLAVSLLASSLAAASVCFLLIIIGTLGTHRAIGH